MQIIRQATSLENKLQYRKPVKASSVVIMVVLLVMLATGAGYLHYSYHKYQKIAAREAIMLAGSLTTLTPEDQITGLTGSPQDLANPEYQRLKNDLIQLAEMTNQIHFAYLLAARADQIIILMDSSRPGTSDYSPPGQVYHEASTDIWQPFQTGESILTHPVTDRWGTWISALVPVRNPVDGSMLAVFGIDFDAAEWQTGIWRKMVPDFLIVLSFFLLMVALLRSWQTRKALFNLSQKLIERESLYRSVFEQSPIGIAIVDNDSGYIQTNAGYPTVNPAYQKILGQTSDALKQIRWSEITHPDDYARDLELYQLFLSGQSNSYSMEKRFIRPDDSLVWTQMTIAPLLGSLQAQANHLCILEDIHARKEAESLLLESERIKSVLISHLPGMAYHCKYDEAWTMLFVSEGCRKLTGYAPESLIQNQDISFNEIILPEYREHLRRVWVEVAKTGIPFEEEYEIRTAQGDRKWVLELGACVFNVQGDVESLEGIILDISDRKSIESNLKCMTEHDVWTGLYNRRYLENRLERDNGQFPAHRRALVVINLSTISLLTRTYGFQYSQNLIKRVADVLGTINRADCQLFNTYENRFTFYLTSHEGLPDLEAFADQVAGLLDSVLREDGIHGGIGIVDIEPSSPQDVNRLLKNLLLASEKAIDLPGSKTGYCFFDRQLEEAMARELAIKQELWLIAQGVSDSLSVQYQPIMDLATNRIAGFEALARLNSQTLGRLSPLEFIPVAEKTKLIIPLGLQVIELALQFLDLLKANHWTGVYVSINVSIIQLMNEGFVDELMQMIRSKQADPAHICLEITESVMESNFVKINGILGEIMAQGLSIALDDFGTGYSSLARERELQVNCLKIDKYFLDKLLTIGEEEAITGDIISMAHKLGHCVIAEGVESESQLDYLRQHGCDKIQGYWLSRPLDPGLAIEFLHSWHGTSLERDRSKA